MVKYAKIENGVVTQVSSKPTSITTSNLWLNPEKMAEEGWLPITDNRPTLNPWETLGARSTEILANEVVFTYGINTTPLNNFKQTKRQQLIQNAKYELENRLDAIEQMPSVYKALPQARRDAMDADALAVVTEVQSKRALINNALTHQEVEDVYITIVAFIDPSRLDENGRIIPDEEII